MAEKTGGDTEFVIIAAVAEKNRVIGKGNDLPWYIPEDLKRFKQLTTGHPMLVGRKTFESIVHQFGGPLPDRRMIVVTSRGEVAGYPEIEAYPTLREATEAVADEPLVFVGGGAEIYRQFLPRADRLELTLVEGDYEGDTFFPPWEHLIGDVFERSGEEGHDGFRFVTFVRKPSEDAGIDAEGEDQAARAQAGESDLSRRR